VKRESGWSQRNVPVAQLLDIASCGGVPYQPLWRRRMSFIRSSVSRQTTQDTDFLFPRTSEVKSRFDPVFYLILFRYPRSG
jgi:hypothetical protein